MASDREPLACARWPFVGLWGDVCSGPSPVVKLDCLSCRRREGAFADPRTRPVNFLRSALFKSVLLSCLLPALLLAHDFVTSHIGHLESCFTESYRFSQCCHLS